MIYFSRRASLKILALWAVVVGTAWPAAAQAPAARFLAIGDFHFDPYDGLTREQFAVLAAAPLERWPELLASQRPAAWGRDSPLALVDSALADARRVLPDPDFILCPGDFLAHGWQNKYDRLAAASRSQNVEAYRTFTTNVLRLLAQRVRQAFPETPFLPVLGNDDSYCGDYAIGPNSPFLAMFAEVWAPLLNAPVAEDALRDLHATFARRGYYTLKLPQLVKHRLIALNTVFFSALYDNACGDPADTPSLDHLDWLEQTLARASAEGESVWLLMHIPPGIDGYSTNQAGGAPKVFWQPELTAKFLQLLQQHPGVVQMAFAGHTHMDDFRLMRSQGQPLLLTKIVPSVSPIFRNNPGYQIFDCDRQTGLVANYQTHHMPLAATGGPAPGASSAGAADAATAARGPWRLEYDFRQAYDLTALNAPSIARLAAKIAEGGPVEQAYLQYYPVGGAPSGIAVKVLRCAIDCATAGEFNACHRGTSLTRE